MKDLNPASIGKAEIIPPDYQAVYSSLARRVAAAYAFALTQNFADSKDELAAAMQVIERVENPFVVINGQLS